MSVIFETTISSLSLLGRGKVRDIYEVDSETLLMVVTDRLSAFDVVFPDPIPGKGECLTKMSEFWFERLADIIPNHRLDIAPESVVSAAERDQVNGRSMVVRRLKPLPFEAVVRGYLAGSAWKDYQRTGQTCGLSLPPGLVFAQALLDPIFTPATKAQTGHDENINFSQLVNLIGREMAERLRAVSLQIYLEATYHAQQRGMLIADTKFEFGTDENGRLYLIDELLTADSSRYWMINQYQPGISPPSIDKQFVRDYLDGLGWNKQPPGPVLPGTVISQTSLKYQEACYRLGMSEKKEMSFGKGIVES